MKSEFAQRRQKLLTQVEPGSLILISSAPLTLRNGSTHYPYRQRSHFYYLTGFEETNAILLLYQDGNTPLFILFNQFDTPEERLWSGPRVGQEKACTNYGADYAYPIHEFEKYVLQFLNCSENVYFLFQEDQHIKEHLFNLSRSVTVKQWIDLEPILSSIRAVKQAEEIARLRKAASISAQAHRRAMQFCRPGHYEYTLEGELLHAFYQHGSRAVAYESIVATGENACILHYQQNTARLKEGELLLIDAGCEYEYYAADISRTFPVNGRFTPAQRQLYTVVLNTQMAVLEAIKPNTTWEALEAIAMQYLTKGLLELGILSGPLPRLMKEKTARQFYPHCIGHALGLDVHDKTESVLKSGMVITIEPGVYIQPDKDDVPLKWRGMGIRIEDNVLVTETGYEILSAEAPKTIDEIEAVMQK
jgi:Xaa-Pro aminopeptidase